MLSYEQYLCQEEIHRLTVLRTVRTGADFRDSSDFFAALRAGVSSRLNQPDWVIVYPKLPDARPARAGGSAYAGGESCGTVFDRMEQVNGKGHALSLSGIKLAALRFLMQFGNIAENN